MKAKMEKLITIILAGGSMFAWYTIYNDFSRFFKIYGTIFRIYDCATPNPVTTPCFYGGFAFLLGLYWSLKGKFNHVYYLLIGGTIFAWSNFLYEAYKFYLSTAAIKVSCSGIQTTNIFTTPCFFGAAIFSLGLLAAYTYRNMILNNFDKREKGQ